MVMSLRAKWAAGQAGPSRTGAQGAYLHRYVRNIFAEEHDHRDNTIAGQEQDHSPEKLDDEFLSFGELHIVGICGKKVCVIKRGIRNNGGALTNKRGVV